METPAAAPSDVSASALESSPAASPRSPAAIIEALHGRRDKVRTLIVCTIDDEHNAEVVWNGPPVPSHLAHLLRMAEVKLDRLYARGMFAKDAPPGPVAGVQGNARQLPPKVAQAIAAAEKRVHKAKASKARQDKALNPHRKQGK